MQPGYVGNHLEDEKYRQDNLNEYGYFVKDRSHSVQTTVLKH